MKFSIKSAGQYSNTLTRLISDFSWYNAEYSGLVKVTEIHKKSQIRMGDLNATLEDEEKEIKPKGKMEQVDPMVRLEMLADLITEKNKIDYAINKEKAKISLTSPITGEEIGIDLAIKENSLYRNNYSNTLCSVMSVESSEEEKVGREQTIIDGKEVVLNYPITIQKESLIKTDEINEKYLDVLEKLRQESDEIDRLQSSTIFEFDNKFSLYENRDSLVKKYSK